MTARRRTALRSAFAAAVLAAQVVSAAAQPRPETARMTCAQAAGLVAAAGAAVLSTGPRTYDRFVAHAGLCLIGEIGVPVWVPTADTPQCPVGVVCRDRPPRLN